MKIVLLTTLQLLGAAAFGGLAMRSAATHSRRVTSPARLSVLYEESEMDYRKRMSGDARYIEKYEAGLAANEALVAEVKAQEEAERAAAEKARLDAMSPAERRREMARIKKEQTAAAAAAVKAKREEMAAAAKAKKEEMAAMAQAKREEMAAAAKARMEEIVKGAAGPTADKPTPSIPAWTFGAAKSAPKPAKQVQAKSAAPQNDKPEVESPSQLFERVAGSVWVPPSRPDLKEKMRK